MIFRSFRHSLCRKFLPIALISLMSWAVHAGELPMLHAQGTQWVQSDGKPVALKGVNLGNWLMLEFWMMGQRSKAIDDQCTLEATLDQRFGYAERERLLKLFRDNWMKQRDWDLIAKFGLNLVRVPFIWSLIEDEKNPRHLRADAWHYLDEAIDQAEQRGIYVVLDLHGAVGSQGHEHHSGCAGKNLYWTTAQYQERTTWLWQQIATRYKNRSAVAGYSLLNEPWGATEEEMATVIAKLYDSVRAVDPHHVLILPGHSSGINAYGKPATRGMRNVAFEIHPYPGHFGWGAPGAEVHRNWLECIPAGSGVCEWSERIRTLDTPLFIGEFQPWANMAPELGAQITRVTYDAYAKRGWASAAWSFKVMSNEGGPQESNWGLVANAADVPIAPLDFATAPLQDIEKLFTAFGTQPYVVRHEVMRWMNSSSVALPFSGLTVQRGSNAK